MTETTRTNGGTAGGLSPLSSLWAVERLWTSRGSTLRPLLTPNAVNLWRQVGRGYGCTRVAFIDRRSACNGGASGHQEADAQSGQAMQEAAQASPCRHAVRDNHRTGCGHGRGDGLDQPVLCNVQNVRGAVGHQAASWKRVKARISASEVLVIGPTFRLVIRQMRIASGTPIAFRPARTCDR